MISSPFNFQKQAQLSQNYQFIRNYSISVQKDLEKNQAKIISSHLQKPKIPKQSKLNRTIFNDTYVTKKFRAEIRNWIYGRSSENQLRQLVAPLSCFYFDFCYLKGINLKVPKIKEFVLASFGMACKLHQSSVPLKIVGSFDNKKIISFEEQIAKTLEFKLNQITYFDIGDEIIRLWSAFQSASMTFEQNQKSQQANFMMVCFFTNCLHKKFARLLFFEFLQYAFHFVQTLEINLGWFVFNAFYFILCTQLYGVTGSVSDEHLESYYLGDSQLSQIMGVFTDFCHYHKYELSLQHDSRIQTYLSLIYNSLIKGFNPSIFQRSDITKFDPDHWMWHDQQLLWNQTHFFADKVESYSKVEKDISSWFVEMIKIKKHPSVISTAQQQQSQVFLQAEMKMEME